MKVLKNESLGKYSLMRIGGIARMLYIPESKEDMETLVSGLKKDGEDYRIISGGSNILINDKRIFDNIIYMAECSKEFQHLGDGYFYVGASVRLQQLILNINNLGYGGIEYLFSVPGMLGGAVVMNAGRGEKFGQSISDYIEEIEVLSQGKRIRLKKEECAFGYRTSVFKHSEVAILGVWFRFKKIEPEVAQKLREDRIRLCREKQDASKPNLGSLLKKGNYCVFLLMRLLQLGYKDGIHFSGKCVNWLINEGNGNFDQAIKLIRISGVIHRLFFCKQELEVIIWE